MKLKVYVVILCLLFSSSIGYIQMSSASEEINYKPYDAGSLIRAANYPIDPKEGIISQENPTVGSVAVSESESYVGETKEWLALDNYYGYYFFTTYTCRAIGEFTEIWVQDDLNWLEGDPRVPPIVTEEQIEYLLMEFESNIYPICTEYFGNPEYHDGSNSLLEAWGYFEPGYFSSDTGRIVIMVSNIVDENYYDPTYPYYVIGFYSPSYEDYFDRNIITIDCYDWEDRVGPDSSQAYESTIAHEFQHLIHDDYNPEDEDFMNEGCSMFSEIICGYPMDWDYPNSFLYTPDNSLTKWEDQGGINTLADYGQAFLWTLYLTDHYGGSDFLRYFVQAGIPGIEGINAALTAFGYKTNFERVFRDWRIANLLHTNQIGWGKYNYKSIDLGADYIIPATVHELKVNKKLTFKGSDFGTTTTILGYDTGVTLLDAYGSDYIKLTHLDKKDWPIFAFNGDDEIPPPMWIQVDQDGDGDLEWYSTEAGSEADVLMMLKVDLYGLDTAELRFDTYFNIEESWDFGFVQVSVDDGLTWTSLENDYTTYVHDTSAYPAIVANLPGLSGASDEWINMGFNLTPYVGQTVVIGFRYMTDWATEYPGWWIDNVMVNDALYDDGDTELNMYFLDSIPAEGYIVTLIKAEYHFRNYRYTMVIDMYLCDLNNAGFGFLGDFDTKDFVYMIVSPKNGPVDYEGLVYSVPHHHHR